MNRQWNEHQRQAKRIQSRIVNVEEYFDTKEQAEQFKTKYEQDWPPAGYGTTLQVIPEGPRTGIYSVKGWRSRSCD